MTKSPNLYVEKMGSSGPAIIMLHGWGCSLATLRPLGELLSSFYKVHLIDLPGFGRSDPPDGIWDSFQYADRLVGYLDDQKIEKVILIGHSFGGKVAMSLANRYPQLIEKLILLAPSGLLRQRTITEQCRYQSIRILGKSLKRIDSILGSNYYRQKFSARFGSSDYQNANATMRPILVKSVNEDLTSMISQIKTPTLILWGEKDSETPPEMGKRLKDLIANAQLLVFPHKGHHLYSDGGSHLCASYIIPFLSRSSE